MSYKIRQVEPDIGRRERKYVKDCLKRRWITEGKYAELFLEKIKEITEAKYAVLAPNGTLAIYMALYSLGIKKGDYVIVPDITFNATASVLPFLGAKPVFCDVDKETMQIDVKEMKKILKEFDIKAIIPVHLYGQSVDMEPLMNLAKENKLLVMEDAAQGLGVKYLMFNKRTSEKQVVTNDQHVGIIGNAGIFAFFSDKHIIMGEGGVVVTNDEKTYLNLKYLRNQGRIQSGSYEHEKIGMNFRITDMQCAVGYAQLERMSALIQKRKTIYKWYEDFMPSQVKMMHINLRSNHVALRCPILVDDKKKVMKHLEENGVQTHEAIYPLHRQPCWKHLMYEKDEFPNANYLYEHGIMLPMHTRLEKSDVRYICDKIKEAL